MTAPVAGSGGREAGGRMIVTGDCVEVMAGMEPESVDAVVCDPPYGLTFMGKTWDRLDGFHAPKDEGRTFTNASGHMYDNLKSLPRYGPATAMQEWHQRWATEALRVAKPGAYLLAFSGTRTVHRLTVALEDAGWIIRDVLIWCYASGFPKSRSSLKPAYEPIVLCRKPGPLRELAIDACRIGVDGGTTKGAKPEGTSHGIYGQGINGAVPIVDIGAGRWPANVVLTSEHSHWDQDPVNGGWSERWCDDEDCLGGRGPGIFDGGWEGVVGGGKSATGGTKFPRRTSESMFGLGGYEDPDGPRTTDDGTYSRFFLLPDPSIPSARGEEKLVGEDQFEVPITGTRFFLIPKAPPSERRLPDGTRSSHPTHKPVELMRHLVRLVTPIGGTVLDPFLGSGSTAIAAEQEGFDWIGIEREAEYVAIAEQRLVAVQRGLGLDVPAPTPRMPKTHPDLSKHQPKRRNVEQTSYSRGWSGADVEPVA